MYKIQAALVKLSNIILKSKFIKTNQMSIHLFPVRHLYALHGRSPVYNDVTSGYLCHCFIHTS